MTIRILTICATLAAFGCTPAFASDHYTEGFIGIGGTFDASSLSFTRSEVTTSSKQDGAGAIEAGIMRRADRIISYGPMVRCSHIETDARQDGATGESHSINTCAGLGVVRVNAMPARSRINVFIEGRAGGSYSRDTVECAPEGEGCTPQKSGEWSFVHGAGVGAEYRVGGPAYVQIVAAHERHGSRGSVNIATVRLALRF